MAYLNFITTIALIIVTGSGVWVAYQGLKTWRNKLVFELARNTLKQAYLVRDKIIILRSLLRSYPFTTEKAEQWKNEVEDWNWRLSEVLTPLLELEVYAVEWEAVYGDELKNVVSELIWHFKGIRISIGDYMNAKRPEDPEEYESKEERMMDSKKIFGSLSENDETHKELLVLIQKITDILKPVIAANK